MTTSIELAHLQCGFQLLWHSLAPFGLEEDADGGGTVAATRNGPWEASLHTLWPARLNTRQGNDWGGIPPRRIPQEEIHEEWQLTLETVEQSRAGAFLTIIGIGREDWPTPMVSRVEADGCAAGVISHGADRTVVGFRLPCSETAVCGDISTDAAIFLLHLKESGKWSCFTAGGTRFQSRGTGQRDLGRGDHCFFEGSAQDFRI